ncbi:MAG: acyl-CoA desaturase [Flavobacteriales bacterium]|nr:acyl-CoA desaturase [Flavobacteriales bacterium]
MSATNFKAVKFIPSSGKEFGVAVRKRVNHYFKSNNISRTGDYRIWIKVIVFPILYLAPFGLIMTNWFSTNLVLYYGLWSIMGIGLAACGFSIMHDACHGSLSKNKSINNFIGSSILNLACGSSLNWKIQHNVLHHSYTNIDGYDEDIESSGIMRFSPHQSKKAFYKFQVFYAWFFYGLMTFFWATFKDFLQLSRYNKKGLVQAQGKVYKKELIVLIIRKVLYYALFLALPILFLELAWTHVLLGWFCMHFIAGLTLACVFQPAHAVPSSEFPLPDENNKVEGDFAMHQLLTTSNFAPNNQILSWFVGGLNFQIEHHLFPNISHVHYKQLSKIVKKTALEFNLPYYSQPSFRAAIINHAKMLYKFGR